MHSYYIGNRLWPILIGYHYSSKFFIVLVAQAGKDVSYFAVILAGFAVTGSSWFCYLSTILYARFFYCILSHSNSSCGMRWEDKMLIVSVNYIYGTKVRLFFSIQVLYCGMFLVNYF